MLLSLLMLLSLRDLEVMVSETLSVKQQVYYAASRANRVLSSTSRRMLKNTFSYRGQDLWRKLYVSYVSSHLEYAAQVWCPHRRGDISKLEKFQRQATKMCTALSSLPYGERLKALKLTTLEARLYPTLAYCLRRECE